jgi:hypothetical protein
MMLAAAIISAIAITGPIPVKYEILKDFQPLIAATVAFAAAGLAYAAAMAKVTFDRSIHIEREANRRRTVRTKTAFIALIFWAEVVALKKRLVPEVSGKREISVSDLRLSLPAELEEAWNNLEFFSPAASKALANVKLNHRQLQAEFEIFGDLQSGKKWIWTWPEKVPSELHRAIDAIEDLDNFACELSALLRSEWVEPESLRSDDNHSVLRK